MSVKWTKEQQKVIDVRGKNVLVSAAAGSGKTAVLVERILSLVCGDKEGEAPMDVDRLLVVTFTKAAASEMRERVGLALEKRLEADPENEHLQKQQTLIHNAQITTIDSFCQYVIRNYFHQIDLDPSFRIADEGELKLLKGDVVKELLEAHYGEEDPEKKARFTEFVEAYATGKSDAGIENLILQLYEFAVSYPYPKRWLSQCRKLYRAENTKEFGSGGWMQFLLEFAGQTFASLEQELLSMLRLCREPGGPYMYEDAVAGDLLQAQELLACRNYEEIRQRMEGLTFARLSPKKDESVSEDKKNQVKLFREGMKKNLKELREKYFSQPLEASLELLKKAAPSTEELLLLAEEFADLYQERKRSKNLADFPDLEHLALEILVEDVREDEEGRLVPIPTDAARELAGHYMQIMIDEYQDSNLIQEIILNSVSGGQGVPNVFMVGDVKQSIYRFRLARPELFMEKYHTYALEDSPQTAKLRIDLHKNFRSRREVLEGTNYVFAQLMTEAVGGIRYDKAAALYLGAAMPEPEETLDPPMSDTKMTDLETGTEDLKKESFAPKRGLNIPELLLLEKDADLEEETAWNQAGAAPKGSGGSEPKDSGGSGQKSSGGSEPQRGGPELTDRELEAKAAAGCIRRLLAEGKVWDKEKECFRPARCKDIVILLRSLTGWGDTYARILTAEGIPAHTESRTGYFTTVEIQTLLNLLRVVDNPRQDIPLAAVLKSMIGGFSDVELAKIKSIYPELPFYEACLCYAKEEDRESAEKFAQEPGREFRNGPKEERLQRKLQSFYEKLRLYRERAEFLSIHELIQELLEHTGYGDYLAAQPAGEQRTANVRMLIERALAFEKTSYRGLFHFVRYIEQLQSYNEDFGEAGILGENEDAVRIMTIHKSKGLEFPVVIVAGLGKSFNRQDTRSRVVIHPELGVGVDFVDAEKRTKTMTLPKRVIQKALDLEMLGEELRVLYVALTRAKEKLILLGSTTKLAEKMQKYEAFGGQETLSFRSISTAGTYLDWILPAAVKKGGEAGAGPKVSGVQPVAFPESADAASPFWVTAVHPTEQVEEALVQQLGREEQREALLHPEELPGRDMDYAKALEERLSFVYPYEEEIGLRGKLSVSELKRAGQAEEEDEDTFLYPEEEIVPYIPRFMQAEEPVSGAARGTAYHRALECLDFTGLYHSERVKEELLRLVEEGRMTKEQAEAVRPYDLYAFAKSSLAKRMSTARKRGEFHAEQPFVIRMPASKLEMGCESAEPVLIQGIIDAYFYEKNADGENEIVIVDYKTDFVKSGGELLGKYKKQLDYYELALQRLTGKRVKEKIIYSFCLKEEVLCR